MKSRRLLRLLAEAGMKGEVVTLSATLVSDFGVSGGTAFAGMIGPVNRRAMAVLGRPLIDYTAVRPERPRLADRAGRRRSGARRAQLDCSAERCRERRAVPAIRRRGGPDLLTTPPDDVAAWRGRSSATLQRYVSSSVVAARLV